MATWCLRTPVGYLKTPVESGYSRTLRTCKHMNCFELSSLQESFESSSRNLIHSCRHFMHKLRQSLRLRFSSRFAHTAHQGFHMCCSRISANFLRKDGTKTLDDPEVVHFGRKIPIIFASNPVQSRGVLRKALLHEMCRFEFDNSLQNDDSNVHFLLILLEKKVTSSSEAKIQNLGRDS